jgi:hypothetical protein
MSVHGTTPGSTPAPTPLSGRQIARRRRTQAFRRNWRLFRAYRSGVAGLVVLAAFVLLALLAPLLASPESIEVTKATGGVLEPPSGVFWLGTDESGRSVLALCIWGSVATPAGPPQGLERRGLPRRRGRSGPPTGQALGLCEGAPDVCSREFRPRKDRPTAFEENRGALR